ncbi:hypothetical protein V6Z11_A03G077700 [Gossypium hirsutum]
MHIWDEREEVEEEEENKEDEWVESDIKSSEWKHDVSTSLERACS